MIKFLIITGLILFGSTFYNITQAEPPRSVTVKPGEKVELIFEFSTPEVLAFEFEPDPTIKKEQKVAKVFEEGRGGSYCGGQSCSGLFPVGCPKDGKIKLFFENLKA